MLKEIVTDKKFIENVIRRFIFWIVNFTAFVFFVSFALSFMTEETVIESLSFLSIEWVIKVTIALILLVTVSEILREYSKRYTL